MADIRDIARAYTGARMTSYDFDHHDPEYREPGDDEEYEYE